VSVRCVHFGRARGSVAKRPTFAWRARRRSAANSVEGGPVLSRDAWIRIYAKRLHFCRATAETLRSHFFRASVPMSDQVSISLASGVSIPVHTRNPSLRLARLPGVAVVAPVLIPRAFTSAIGSSRARLTRRRQGAPVGRRAAERDRFD